MDANYPAWVYFGLFLSGALTTGMTLPLWIRLAPRLGIVDQPGHRKIHAAPIPLAGGLAVATGLVVPLIAGIVMVRFGLLGSALNELSAYGLNQRTVQLLGLVGGALGMLGLGLIDDRSALSARTKLIGQIGVALIVAITGTRITLFVPSTVFSYFITVLWFLTVVNAFNFTDNMNGLCTGLACISALTLAFHGTFPGHYLVASLGFLVAGALAGFIPFNYPNARAFLGDSGSHLVGYLIAAMAVLPHFHHEAQPNRLSVVAPLLILGMVFIDLCWVVGFRIWHRRPVYIGDTNHISHQLVRRGFSQSTAVALIWILHAILAAASLLLI